MWNTLLSFPDQDLQQNYAPVHLQPIHGGNDSRADLQSGCHRHQPAHVVFLPVPKPLGYASPGKGCVSAVGVEGTTSESSGTCPVTRSSPSSIPCLPAPSTLLGSP